MSESQFVCIMRPQFESPGGGGSHPGAMSERRVDDPDANPPWVLNVKKRLPRHQDPQEEPWFLDSTLKSALRWAAAEQDMMKTRALGHVMLMQQVFDEIRRDIGVARACWQPQKWTTMVQGRPVQAQ